MKNLPRLLQLDWQDIGHKLLQSAAVQMAETARLRADLPAGVIATEEIAAGHLRLSVRTPELIRREQGDGQTSPQPFLAPNGPERAAIRDSMIVQLRKAIA